MISATPALPKQAYETDDNETEIMITLTLTETKRARLLRVLDEAQAAHEYRTAPLLANRATHDSVRAYVNEITETIRDARAQIARASVRQPWNNPEVAQ